MPYDGSKVGLRELSKSSSHTLPVASPNGKQQDSSSPRAQRNSNSSSSRFTFSQLLSRQYGIFWLVWLLLLGVFLIRHTTKLLDAAGQQHYLLAPPTAATAAPATHAGSTQQQQKQAAQHHDSTQAAGSQVASTFVSSSSSSTGAEAILAAQRSKWPHGYIAVCAVIKDQWPDLRYWIEYHRWLGVSKFYIYDNNSTLPAMLMLWDYMREGIVEYDYFLGRPRRRPDFTDTNQYRAYQGCLLQHFKQHRWLAFIDADEFFVLPPQGSGASNSSSTSTSTDSSHADQLPGLQGNNAQQRRTDVQHAGGDQQQHGQRFGFLNDVVADPSQATRQHGGDAPTPAAGGSGSSSASPQPHNLALFLSDFEGQAALGVNWVLFGSSGHLARPTGGPLGAYTACVPRTHWESTHVKVIANTAGVLGVGGTPHEVLPRAGKSIVDVDKVPFKGPKTPQAKWHKLVLHHYVLKSKAEFVAKQARGSGAGNKKDWGYWEYVEKLANQTCSEGVPVSAAFLASQPRLRLPASAHVLQGCHSKAVAAYEALLSRAKDGSGGAAAGQQEDIELLPC